LRCSAFIADVSAASRGRILLNPLARTDFVMIGRQQSAVNVNRWLEDVGFRDQMGILRKGAVSIPAAFDQHIELRKRCNMELGRLWVLKGPNIWAAKPVIEAGVDLGLGADRPPRQTARTAERLRAWLPSVPLDLDGGGSLAHVLE